LVGWLIIVIGIIDIDAIVIGLTLPPLFLRRRYHYFIIVAMPPTVTFSSPFTG